MAKKLMAVPSRLPRPTIARPGQFLLRDKPQVGLRLPGSILARLPIAHRCVLLFGRSYGLARPCFWDTKLAVIREDGYSSSIVGQWSPCPPSISIHFVWRVDRGRFIVIHTFRSHVAR